MTENKEFETHKVGNPDPTPCGGCPAATARWECTWETGHGGDHVAGDGYTIRHVWPQAPALESLPTAPVAHGWEVGLELDDFEPPAGEPEREALAAILFHEFSKVQVAWERVVSRKTWIDHADAILAAGYRHQPEPREVTTCDRQGWLEDDQDDDNPCVCGLPVHHDGLHACFEGCGGEWAGGTNTREVTP